MRSNGWVQAQPNCIELKDRISCGYGQNRPIPKHAVTNPIANAYAAFQLLATRNDLVLFRWNAIRRLFTMLTLLRDWKCSMSVILSQELSVSFTLGTPKNCDLFPHRHPVAIRLAQVRLAPQLFVLL
jgi:hypothetical protein